MMKRLQCVIILHLLFLLLYPWAAFAETNSSEQVETAFLEADDFSFDQQNAVFTATGHVELEQDGQIVTADEMVYDQKKNQVMAKGNVVFRDKTGQTYFAKEAKLEQGLKTGVIEQIGLIMADGSRLAARQGVQENENKIVLRDGVYSPCKLCKDNPKKAPTWQLRAKKVVHDKIAKDVYYHDVKLDAYGVPIGYLPYFSHPDPSVKARTGFLMSGLSGDSKNGFMLRNYYYKNISPTEDATFELSTTQNSGTILGTEYRNNFQKGTILFNGSINRSAVRGGSNNNEIIKPEKYRGHIFADASYRLDPYWSTGVNIRRTFDNFYLRDFQYSSADVLVNNAYLQRIKDRDYTNVTATYFQDLRPDIFQNQSDVLPLARHSMIGAPNQTFGGRWSADNSFVTLFRDGQQAVSRISSVPSWERRDILPYGFQTTVNTALRADGFWIRQNTPFESALDAQPNIDKIEGRLFPTAQGILAYPLVRPSRAVTALIEPKVALTLAPNSANNSNIPNEDSRDAQIDISNLFNVNRFPGIDRVENGSHMAYGVKFGGYHDNGNSAFMALGQSYHLNGENPFPEGSGLEEDRSDLVGQIETTFYNKFYTDYRFQLDEENLDDRRHELQAAYLDDGLEIRTNYIFAQVVEGTGLQVEDRQQLGFAAAKSITREWSASFNSLSNLTGEAGLLKAGVGVQYKNDCLRVSLRGERNLTQQLSGGSDSRVLFSLGLRNLGGYDTPLLDFDPLYSPFGGTGRL